MSILSNTGGVDSGHSWLVFITSSPNIDRCTQSPNLQLLLIQSHHHCFWFFERWALLNHLDMHQSALSVPSTKYAINDSIIRPIELIAFFLVDDWYHCLLLQEKNLFLMQVYCFAHASSLKFSISESTKVPRAGKFVYIRC